MTKFDPLNGIVLIEDDASISYLVEAAMRKGGLPTPVHVEDGESAWRLCQDKAFDLIVLDWKIPNVAGPALLNRFRQDALHQFTPILVISGFIQQKDFRLVDEMPLTSILEKPFSLQKFLTAAEKLLEEGAWFEKNSKRFNLLLDRVENADTGFVRKAMLQIESSPNPIPIAVQLAKRLMLHRKFDLAHDLLLRFSDRRGLESLAVRTELAKLHLICGRTEQAKGLLLRAYEASPENIQRLCLLGQISVNDLRPDQAQKYFREALDIDRSHKSALEGQEMAGKLEEYMYSAVASVPQNFASLINARAIAMVRSGAFQEGIDQYKMALNYVFNDRVRSRLLFNIGLAYLRWKKARGAQAWFQKSAKLAEPGFEKKSQKFLDRIERDLSHAYAKKTKSYTAAEKIPDGISSAELDELEDLGIEWDEQPVDLGEEAGHASSTAELQPHYEDETLPQENPASEPRAIQSELDLLGVLPEFKQVFDILRQGGHYVEAQVLEFAKLVHNFDREILREALRHGIKTGRPTAQNTRFTIRQISKKSS